MNPIDKFKIIKQLGDGSFGTVMQGTNKQTGEMVCGHLFGGSDRLHQP
jgi:serine/threonine protein kinase